MPLWVKPHLNSKSTTLQIMMNAKLSHQGFWRCHENGHGDTIPIASNKLCVQDTKLLLRVRLNLSGISLNPEKMHEAYLNSQF